MHILDKNGQEVTDVVLDDAVTVIPDYAFYNCKNLQSITIPDSVTSIGYSVFSRCTSLTGIWVDEQNSAYFSDNAGVLYNKNKTMLIQAPGYISGSYEIPDSVTSIGEDAFYDCGSLTSLTISDSVTNVVYGAFFGCKIQKLIISEGARTVTPAMVMCRSTLEEIIIPDSVISINDSAFSNCKSITDITIPDSVTSIGDYAFSSCESLVSITIPDSVTSIGSSAFAYCSSLERIINLGNVNTIGMYALNECRKLQSIAIPETVTTIEDSVFSNCISLTDIYFGGTQRQWEQISIGVGNNISADMVHYNHIHDYSLIPPVMVEAGCETGACIEYTCVFGDTYREEIPGSAPLGHDFSEISTVVEPGCVTEGYTETKCNRCGEIIKTDFVNTLKHKMVVLPAVAPTCIEEGHTARTYCERCGFVGVREITLPATGHTFVDGICTVCDAGRKTYLLTDGAGNAVANYMTLSKALDASQAGQTIVLYTDGQVDNLILPAGVSLDLNGYTMTVDSVMTYSGSSIIDGSEAVAGLLKIGDYDGNMISETNSQLPVYDKESGGLRFFQIEFTSQAVTGKNAGNIKYWFKFKVKNIEKFGQLLQLGGKIQLKVKMTWAGQLAPVYAVADTQFAIDWVSGSMGNENLYITVTATGAETLEKFRLIPCLAANGVEICGVEMY